MSGQVGQPLSVDIDHAINQARMLYELQRVRGDFLEGRRPEFPVHAFGRGLASRAGQLGEAISRAHDVGVRHSRLLQQAALEGEKLLGVIAQADAGNQNLVGGTGGAA